MWYSDFLRIQPEGPAGNGGPLLTWVGAVQHPHKRKVLAMQEVIVYNISVSLF